MNSTTVPRLQRFRKWRWLSRALILTIGLTLVTLVTLAVGTYSGTWQGQRTTRLLHFLPLPAGYIGNHRISFESYFVQRRALEQSSAYLETKTGGVYTPTAGQDSGGMALTKVIRLAESEILLRQLKMSITDAEVQQAVQDQVIENNNPELVANSIRNLYGWTIEEYGQYVVRPAVILNKIQEKLSFDDKLNTTARQQAERVLTLVTAGQGTFEEIAKKYSDDTYGANGGDIGFVKLGEQVKEIDDAVATLQVNQTSPLIHTKYGFHIVKVLERKTIDNGEQTHLLQITILAPQVDVYLNQALKNQNVRIFVPGYRWDRSTVRVVRTTSNPTSRVTTNESISKNNQ